MKKLKVEFYTILEPGQTQADFNIEGNGFYLLGSLSTGATLTIDGAVLNAAFGRVELTVQPNPNHYIKKNVQFRTSGGTGSNVLIALFKYEDE
jgi:hypothetical protein